MFNTLFYAPLYNGLIWIIDILPNHDVGIAVVLLTLVVSTLMFSISKKSIKTQLALKEIEPDLKKIKESVKDPQEQAKQIMALYKKNKVNPFSMILMVLIQFPILIALYYVFMGLPTIRTEFLYSFINAPETVNMMFLGILDISKKSVFMAVLAGITQFIQGYIVTAKNVKPEKDKVLSMQEEFAHSMQMSMKYFLPFMIGFIGLGFPSALPLYWSVRNIFTASQELYIRKGKK
jgi:YidC/Oxa1 family membrane protein insertase